ncbi:hypothetical protein HOP38_02540 [Vibrio mediterranei]|uniref:hypothetical protein n=1 Tax=Vibrio mediterranei TaxID=689 RepID=UPI0018364A6E|nr:hypothetical protein [Vibrio mediterranei]NUW71390.1 hypothetical protein [Vibrio mediterranei]
MERYIIAGQISENLGITLDGLNKMIARGDFPKADIGNGRGSVRRWKESTIKKWEDSLGSEEDDS